MNAGPQPLTAGTTAADRADRADRATSPYPGLRSFGADDEPHFFGRAELLGAAVRRFWQALDEPERSAWMWVVGPSGSGKTSLLQAGLCPRLDTVGYATVSLTPGADPMGALAEALATHLDVDPVAAVSGLGDEPARWLAGQRRNGGGTDTELVLVVDRFEDLFRLSPPDQRRRFVDTLLSLSAPGRTSRCVVIAGLDVAFYPQAADAPGLAASLPDAQVLVAPLRDDELRMAVMEPARATGYAVDDDVAELILADAAAHEAAASGPGAAAPDGAGPVPTLPLVAHALRETWQRANGRTLTAAGYREAGGLVGAVEASGEAVWADLDSAQRKLAGQIIGHLTEQRGEDLVPVTLPTPDLAALGDRTAVGEVVDRFVDAGLLTTDGGGLQVGHAALLSAWPRIGTLARDHAGRRRGRAAGGTAAASDAAVATSGPAVSPPASSGARAAVQRRLDAVRRSRRARRRESGRANDATGPARVPWPLVAVPAVVALAAVSVAAVVGEARRDAETERDAALARETASTAEELQADDPALGVEVAVAGHSVADTTESRSALLDAASGPVPARWLGGPGPAVISIATEGDLVAVGDSTDATVQIFTAGSGEGDLTRSGVVDLQDLPDPAEVEGASDGQAPDGGSGDGAVPADDAEVELATVGLTPDGNLLVTGDSVGRVALWDLTESDAPELVGGPLEGPAGPVQDLAVSPDGAELAVAADGEALLRWSLEDPADPEPLAAVTTLATPSSVAYSSVLPVAAVGTEAGTVQVWNLADGPELIEDRVPGERPIRSVAFAPDGEAMAAAGRDGELYLWDIADGFAGAGRVDLDTAEFDESVNAVAFSADGEHVVAGSADRAVRVWSTRGGRSLAELRHPAPVTGASFHGDGQLLSTTGDGTTRMWDLARAVPFQVNGQVRSMAATLDGERLAVASTSEARVWEVGADGATTGELLARVDSDVDGVGDLTGAVDLSPSGDLLALGADGVDEVHLVDVTAGDGPELLATAGPEDADTGEADGADPSGDDAAGDDGATDDPEPGAVAVAFSPAGQVAAAGRDGQVHVWEANGTDDDPALLGTVADATDEIRDLTWGPEGDLLAVTSADGRVYLYGVDARGPELTGTLGDDTSDDGNGEDNEDGEGRPVGNAGPRAAAFTSSGDRLVTVGVADGSDGARDTGVLLMWDLDDPAAPRVVAGPVPGPRDVLVDVAVDPTDELVAAAALDGTSWVWDLPELEDAGPLDRGAAAVPGEDDDDVPEPWLVLGTGEGPLRAVEFGPDGEILRAGRDDGRVRTWPLEPEDAAAEICEGAGDPVSPEEWAAHLPGLDYEPPC